LGRALIAGLTRDYEITAVYLGNYWVEDTARVRYKKLDIRDKRGQSALFKDFRPEVVIHAAGVGSPDFAQANKEFTRQVNVLGTQNIVSCCKKFQAKFIYISSNAVYDGEKAPYGESDPAKPINYYGRIKLEGEKITRDSGIIYAIVRPIMMYGWNYPFERINIATIALEKLKKHQPFFAYDDVFCNPLSVEFCARAILRMIQKSIYDVFNIGGKDTVSVYEFTRTLCEVFGLDSSLVKPVQQGFFKGLVKRPKDTSYNTAKMEKILGMPPLVLREGLELMREARKTYA